MKSYYCTYSRKSHHLLSNVRTVARQGYQSWVDPQSSNLYDTSTFEVAPKKFKSHAPQNFGVLSAIRDQTSIYCYSEQNNKRKLF